MTMLPVAILAGGMARRLGRLAEATAKALVDINGEPFIAHQLRLLRASGIGRVVVCAGHLGEQVQEFVGDGALVPSGEFYDLTTLYQDLLLQDQLAAYEIAERFYEIGSLAGLEETRRYLRRVAPDPVDVAP